MDPKGPAWGKLRVGDGLIAIDGQEADGSEMRLYSMLLGLPGTPIELDVLPRGLPPVDASLKKV